MVRKRDAVAPGEVPSPPRHLTAHSMYPDRDWGFYLANRVDGESLWSISRRSGVSFERVRRVCQRVEALLEAEAMGRAFCWRCGRAMIPWDAHLNPACSDPDHAAGWWCARCRSRGCRLSPV